MLDFLVIRVQSNYKVIQRIKCCVRMVLSSTGSEYQSYSYSYCPPSYKSKTAYFSQPPFSPLSVTLHSASCNPFPFKFQLTMDPYTCLSPPPNLAADGGRRCDYCSSAVAVLHCRADSALLCLPCDRLVHSANALSRRHSRAPLCSSCFSHPASFRHVSSSRLPTSSHQFLCSDCDVGSDPAPLKFQVESFSGCPSAFELARSWGIDIRPSCPGLVADPDPIWSEMDYSSFLAVDPVLRELYVPSDPPLEHNNRRRTEKFQEMKDDLVSQLMEMGKREDDNNTPKAIGPDTPCQSGGGGKVRSHDDDMWQVDCMSLLNSGPSMEEGEEEEGEDALVWNSTVSRGSTAEFGPSQVLNCNYLFSLVVLIVKYVIFS
jgi:hypothetical protein